MDTKLTEEELIRYSRHLVLKDFGLENQLKLKDAKVLVVGAGGLGSPALLYLAAAGVGVIGIADFDSVALSNLQRQVLFTKDDIGKNKAEAAAFRLSHLNSNIHFNKYTFKLDATNALNVIEKYDVVVDGTDNFPTRYLLNDACVLLGKPLVYGSILQFEGQLSVFNMKQPDGSFSANYRDLFPEPPDAASVQNCEQAGVLGVLPGIIGSMQASEVIKIVTRNAKPLTDKLVIFDAQSMELTTIAIPSRNSRDQIKSLIDYEDFCGINPKNNKSLGMKEITVQELDEMRKSGADFQLIDVREPYEFDICNLEGELIPMSDIPNNVDKISKDKQVVVHCRSGKRSGDMVLWLEKTHGFTNLYNLKGGVLAWAREIDTDMPTY